MSRESDAYILDSSDDDEDSGKEDIENGIEIPESDHSLNSSHISENDQSVFYSLNGSNISDSTVAENASHSQVIEDSSCSEGSASVDSIDDSSPIHPTFSRRAMGMNRLRINSDDSSNSSSLEAAESTLENPSVGNGSCDDILESVEDGKQSVPPQPETPPQPASKARTATSLLDGAASNVQTIVDHYEDDVLTNNVEHSPKRSLSLGSPDPCMIDLTESDSSLQNSPAGVVRQGASSALAQRSVQDIVSELSQVDNDIMVQESLLDSINVDSLPDNGYNLARRIETMKKKRQELQKELENTEEYQFQASIEKSRLSSKQSTLPFFYQPIKEKEEKKEVPKYFNPVPQVMPKLSEVKRECEDFDDRTQYFSQQPDMNVSKMPDWGDLPQPDLTISNFGKKAMERHLNEKCLTVETLSKLHNALKACPTEDTVVDDPRNLRVELLPHQKHGLAWMLWREKEVPSGGILADDMGLGKTLSMIALILKDAEMKEDESEEDSDSDDDSPKWMRAKYSKMVKGGTLVVCPASVIYQWEKEIYKRVKKRVLSVELYHGPKRETKPRRLAEYDVVLTTYNLVSRESGVDTAKKATSIREKGPLFYIKWDRIILDEAHMVRNHKSQMAMGVCELKGRHRWCLTGTPIQNKELDLYALMKFLQCSPFDDLAVWKKWVDNKNVAGMQRLSTMMKALMLRRTKEQLHARGDLNCLPQKTCETIDVHLDEEELAVYEKVALFSQSLFAQFLSQRAEKQQALDARYGFSTKPTWEQGDAPDNQFTTTLDLAKLHRKMRGFKDIKTHEILVLLLRLRQICIHPGLVKKMVEDGDLDFEVDGKLDDVDLFEKMNNLNINESDVENGEEEKDLNKSGVFSVDSPVFSFDRPSAKFRAILDLIEEKFLDCEDKIIIVSQWTSVLEIFENFLKRLQIRYEMLTGKVPVDKRQDIVNEFNKSLSGPKVLLLSLTAGGVGLNLVGANHLLLVDLHWNPQLEAQARDRIYRVGQKKDVFIYRFVTVNTIEESIKMLQDRKLAMADHVLTGTRNTETSKLTLDDLKMLFSVPSTTSEPMNNL